MTARDFLLGLSGVSRTDREAAVLAARDLWVSWPLVPVPMCGGRLTIYVTSDVFALGSAEDPIRVPLSARGAQAVADTLVMSLITPHISDAIWRSSSVRLAPYAGGPPYDSSMLSVNRLLAHNDRVEASRDGRGGLIAGHKKDVVLSNRLETQPRQVAIYGWHRANGEAIQPLSLVHEASYADYSHGVRLVSNGVEMDGRPALLSEAWVTMGSALTSPSEGVLRVTRYPR